MGDLVLYESDGHLVTITYNRPDARNAINGEMRDAINRAFTRFRSLIYKVSFLFRYVKQCASGWPLV